LSEWRKKDTTYLIFTRKEDHTYVTGEIYQRVIAIIEEGQIIQWAEEGQ
jgi:activator of HSP90 ATPase